MNGVGLHYSYFGSGNLYPQMTNTRNKRTTPITNGVVHLCSYEQGGDRVGVGSHLKKYQGQWTKDIVLLFPLEVACHQSPIIIYSGKI